MAGARPKSATPSMYKGSEEIIESRKSVTPSMYKGSEEIIESRKSATPSMYKGSEEIIESRKSATPSMYKGSEEIVEFSTETCKVHNGEQITNFCMDHNQVVCNLCASVEHRTCGSVDYISKIAGTSQARETVPKVRREVISSLKVIQTAKVHVQKRTPINDQDKAKHLATIKDNTTRVIEHARRMEQSAIAEVNKRHQDTANKIASELAQLDDSEAILQQRLKSLDNAQSNNDSQVFVDTKMGITEAGATIQLEQRLQSSDVKNVVRSTFVLDDGVDVFVNDVTSLGKVIANKPFKAALKGSYNIKHNGDDKFSHITNICELPNGDILMTDNNNDCIKTLNKVNKVSKRFITTSGPYGICQTGQFEIAFTLPGKKKVQFVDISGSWKLTKSFMTEEKCRGIISSNNELIISCGSHPGFVAFTDKAGSKRRKIYLNGQDRQLFNTPRHLVTTHNGTKIHIADWERGVITVNRQGKVISTFSQNIKNACGLCAVGGEDLVVCGHFSHNAVQINTDGELVSELLSENDGREWPLSVMYSPSRSLLIVTSLASNEIQMFELKV